MNIIKSIIVWIVITFIIIVLVAGCSEITVSMINYKVCQLYGYSDASFRLEGGYRVVCTKTIYTPLGELTGP